MDKDMTKYYCIKYQITGINILNKATQIIVKVNSVSVSRFNVLLIIF